MQLLSRYFLSIVIPAALLSFCSAPIRQFFPDTYFPQDHVYQNKPLGFDLNFADNWTLTTDPDQFSKTAKKIAHELQESHDELIFLGSTVEGSQGTRGIAQNWNMSNEEYLAATRKANLSTIDEDLGSRDFEGNGIDMIVWDYRFKGFRFSEYLFKARTCNVRIAFWAAPDLFYRFAPVYESIMNSIEMIDRY